MKRQLGMVFQFKRCANSIRTELMAHIANTLVFSLLLCQLVPVQLLAVNPSSTPSLLDSGGVKTDKFSRAEEYFSEQYQGEILVSVNLLGEFGRPGVYHIPKQTDVMRLFALAGGTKSGADIENILIKRRSGEAEKVYTMNLKDMMEKPAPKNLNLESNDVILINTKEPIISQNTIQVVGIVASVLGVLVSTVVLARGFKN